MQIKAINNYSNNKLQNPQFKSAYPVYHWVEKADKKYVVAVTKNEVEKMQSKLVRMLNKTLSRKDSTKAAAMDKVISVVNEADSDYSMKSEVRSFYNPKGGWKENFFEPITYLITGRDTSKFDKVYGKPIGKAKAISKTPSGKYCSLELEDARDNYEKNGLKFVKQESKIFTKNNETPSGLHIIHTPVYYQKGAKKGEVKEYLPKWVLYRPESGANNPFVKLGLVKQN